MALTAQQRACFIRNFTHRSSFSIRTSASSRSGPTRTCWRARCGAATRRARRTAGTRRSGLPAPPADSTQRDQSQSRGRLRGNPGSRRRPRERMVPGPFRSEARDLSLRQEHRGRGTVARLRRLARRRRRDRHIDQRILHARPTRQAFSHRGAASAREPLVLRRGHGDRGVPEVLRKRSGQPCRGSGAPARAIRRRRIIWYYFLYPGHEEFLRRCEAFFDKKSDGDYEGDWNAVGVS